MQKQTVISTPSIADTNNLFAIWRAIPGNGPKALSDFYSFLIAESPESDLFLAEYTEFSYDNIAGDIVVLKVTSK